ncbi:MAG: VPLPA-CTERM sorting domain-containing protein [Deltaproteobacteria bacterium]|nr:VPLPA-CTERM sorting domain-containing protein [Deltaproteobacteria bacterium]
MHYEVISQSEAYAEDSFNFNEGLHRSDGWVPTRADAVRGWAKGHGWTEGNGTSTGSQIGEEVLAEANIADNPYAYSWAYGYRSGYFEVPEDPDPQQVNTGQLTITVNYNLSQNLQTDNVDEFAYGWALADLWLIKLESVYPIDDLRAMDLEDIEFLPYLAEASDEDVLDNEVFDGDDIVVTPFDGTLIVTLNFAQGEAGFFDSFAENEAFAAIVPIPSAVWLLLSGLIGFAGFRRKLRNGRL